MFEDKIEAMNQQPNTSEYSSGYEKRVYNNGYSQYWEEHRLCSRKFWCIPFCKGRRSLQNIEKEL